MRPGIPSETHEDRVAFLDATAHLAGYTCTVRFIGRLRPDVLRVTHDCLGIFLGEAKASEPPGDVGACARLARYLSWSATARPMLRTCVVALCCPCEDGTSWAAVLASLCSGAGLEVTVAGQRLVASSCVVWSVYRAVRC